MKGIVKCLKRELPALAENIDSVPSIPVGQHKDSFNSSSETSSFDLLGYLHTNTHCTYMDKQEHTNIHD